MLIPPIVHYRSLNIGVNPIPIHSMVAPAPCLRTHVTYWQ